MVTGWTRARTALYGDSPRSIGKKFQLVEIFFCLGVFFYFQMTA